MDRRFRTLTVAVTLIAGGVIPVGCASQRQDHLTSVDTREQVLAVAREREAELSTLRSEMAATRIAAAKKEAELVELRALVAQLRQEKADTHQRQLEQRQSVEVRQAEINALKAERDQLLLTKNDQSLKDLKEGLLVLTKQLEDVRQDIGQKASRTSEKAFLAPMGKNYAPSRPAMIPSSLQGTQAQFFDGPASISAISVLAVNTTQSPSNVLRVRVQPGDSLSSLSRKYRTTVSAIQELNHLPTDVIAVGRELLVPVPSPSSIERER